MYRLSVPSDETSSSDDDDDSDAGQGRTRKRRKLAETGFVQVGKPLMVAWREGQYEAVVIDEDGPKVKVHFKVRAVDRLACASLLGWFCAAGWFSTLLPRA